MASKDDEESKTKEQDVVESDASAEDVHTDKSIPPEVDKEAPTDVWWDMENTSAPYDVPPEDVYNRIVRKLREEGFNGPVNVIGVVAYADSVVPPHLSSEIRVHHALNTNRPDKGSKNNQVADAEIKKLIRKWRKAGHKPQNAMLITGDYGFKSTLCKLARAGHRVLLSFRVDENQNVTSSEDDKLSLLTLRADEKQNVKFTKDNKLAKLSKYAHFYWNLRVLLSAPEKAISKRKRSEEFVRRKKEEAEFEEAKKRKTKSEAEFEEAKKRKTKSEAEFEEAKKRKTESEAEFEEAKKRKTEAEAEFEEAEKRKTESEAGVSEEEEDRV